MDKALNDDPDFKLWRGSPEEYALRNGGGKPKVTAEQLESAFIRSAHPLSADHDVLRFKPGPDFTNEALAVYARHLMPDDSENVPFFHELERRRYFAVTLRPDNPVQWLIRCKATGTNFAQVAPAWSQLKRMQLANDQYPMCQQPTRQMLHKLKRLDRKLKRLEAQKSTQVAA